MNYGIDPTFATNDFSGVKYLNQSETIAMNILTILFGKPGFYPTLPTLGMNIQSLLYNFNDEINISAIKTKLVSQCAAFYDAVREETFDMRFVNKSGQEYLLIILPVITVSKKNVLTIGITLSNDKSAIYNYVFTEDSYY